MGEQWGFPGTILQRQAKTSLRHISLVDTLKYVLYCKESWNILSDFRLSNNDLISCYLDGFNARQIKDKLQSYNGEIYNYIMMILRQPTQ